MQAPLEPLSDADAKKLAAKLAAIRDGRRRKPHEPMSSPLKLRDKAYDSFTERLLSREIKPGQFVSTAGTGRDHQHAAGRAIRELIPRLEAEGLITTVPQRGMQSPTST